MSNSLSWIMSFDCKNHCNNFNKLSPNIFQFNLFNARTDTLLFLALFVWILYIICIVSEGYEMLTLAHSSPNDIDIVIYGT